MRINTIYITGAMLILVAVVAGIFLSYQQQPPSNGEHTWTAFQNSTLGFTLEYPSDLLTPVPDASSATTTIDFPYIGKTSVGNADDGIRIGTEDTDVKDAAAYFALPGVQVPYPPTPIVIGGLSAMELDEMAYADYTIYLVRDGKLYVIVINLPPAEAARVKNSFQFSS